MLKQEVTSVKTVSSSSSVNQVKEVKMADDLAYSEKETELRSRLRASSSSGVNVKQSDEDIRDDYIEDVEDEDNAIMHILHGTERLQHMAAEKVEKMLVRASAHADRAEKIIRHAIDEAWGVCHFSDLPAWLQDNDYLHFGHRPQLDSFRKCFWSIFRLHTETCNIWTHLLGFMLFTVLAVVTMCTGPDRMQLIDRLVLGSFFGGAIVCLGLSSMYHTVSCHSQQIGLLFSKLDYCGISLLITGSFIPCIYYGFYCEFVPKILYSLLATALCICTIFVSFSERFSEPHLRPLRAGVFMLFGLSGVFPGVHWLLAQDWFNVANLRFSLFCILAMAVLYITGAALYAMRIPERFFPGKCDVWFHSHQLFHVFVIAAAFVHYQGIHEMALYRMNNMCETDISYLMDPSKQSSSSLADFLSIISFRN